MIGISETIIFHLNVPFQKHRYIINNPAVIFFHHIMGKQYVLIELLMMAKKHAAISERICKMYSAPSCHIHNTLMRTLL